MNKKTILITGCSSGIGLESSCILKQRGHRVIASCRKEEDRIKLQDLGFETLLLDMNDSKSIQAAFSKLVELTNNRLDVLINNAGFGQAGALEDISRDILRQQFETNVFGLHELTTLVIPLMRGQGEGRIINISSILGVISMPFRGAYNASKYAVEGLTDTLRLELKSSGIHVITIQPGPIESRFRDNCVDNSLQNINMKDSYFNLQYQSMLSTYKAAKANSIFTRTAKSVTSQLIHAIESKRPRSKYSVTFPAYLFAFLKRVLPTQWLDGILLLISKKELSSRNPH